MSRYLLHTGAVVILALAAAGVAEARGGGNGGGSRGSGHSSFKPSVFSQNNGKSMFTNQSHNHHLSTQSLKSTAFSKKPSKGGKFAKDHKHHHRHKHHRDLDLDLSGEAGDGGGDDSGAGDDSAVADGNDSADAGEQSADSSSAMVSTSDAVADEGDTDSADADQAAGDQWQTQRAMQVKNNSGKQVTVFLQYRTQQESGDFVWMPADPEKSTMTVSFVLKPGEVRDLQTSNGPIAASRVRFWAVAKGRKWVQFKAKDLWLVPEVGADGEHRYEGEEMDTFTLKLPR
jgi:hypothetical protein